MLRFAISRCLCAVKTKQPMRACDHVVLWQFQHKQKLLKCHPFFMKTNITTTYATKKISLV